MVTSSRGTTTTTTPPTPTPTIRWGPAPCAAAAAKPTRLVTADDSQNGSHLHHLDWLGRLKSVRVSRDSARSGLLINPEIPHLRQVFRN